MKSVPILLSLATLGVTAVQGIDEVTGNIRGRKLVTNKTKRDAGKKTKQKYNNKKTKKKVVVTNDDTKNKPSITNRNLNDEKYIKARQNLVQRREIGDNLHNVLIKRKTTTTKTTTSATAQVDDNMNVNKDEMKKKGKTTQDRELKKAKTFKGSDGNYDYWDDDDNYGYSKAAKSSGGGGGGGMGSSGMIMFDDDDSIMGLGGGSRGGSGKSGYSGDSAKAGKNRDGGGGIDYMGSAGGKSGKSGGGGTCGDYHYVEVTNVSYEQKFSEIFIMTAAHEVTELLPLYIMGNSSNPALAKLAENADASEMMDRYINRRGVEQVKIFSDFDEFGIEVGPYLPGGATAKFKVNTAGHGERLTIAVGLPFTNDGVVVLQGAEIYDGADYLISALDVGAEANIHTCWSVAASKDDFPANAACATDELSDENSNDLPGEGFVHMHRGFQDIDTKEEFENLLLFPECEDILDKEFLDGTERFARYFYEVGFDDDFLLCGDDYLGTIDPGFGIGGRPSGYCRNPRDDEDFLDIINTYDDFLDNRYTEHAKDSTDFDDFCAAIKEENKEIEQSFVQLEPYLFDWRNELMHVTIHCDHHGEGLLRDSLHPIAGGNAGLNNGLNNGLNKNDELTILKQELENVKEKLDKVNAGLNGGQGFNRGGGDGGQGFNSGGGEKEPKVGVLEVAGMIPFEQLVNGTKSAAGP